MVEILDKGEGGEMIYIKIFILSCCCQGLLVCFWMLFRNQKVYEFRKWVIENKFCFYDKLPSYDSMLCDDIFKFDWTEYLPNDNKKIKGEGTNE